MSKFWFFDRKGRPTNTEKSICDKLNSLMNNGELAAKKIEDYIEEYGKPVNEKELDEMFGYFTGNFFDGEKYQYADSDYELEEGEDEEDFSDENDYDSSFSENDSSNSVNSDAVDFNPFEEPVIERSYTQGFKPKDQYDDDDSDSEYSDDDSDSDSNSNEADFKFSKEDMEMPKDGGSIEDEIEEDIPEPEWANSDNGFSDDEDEDADFDEEDEGENDDTLGGDNLEDLSPAQKRKAAEKTAEAFLNMYCQFAPLPFKKWASISDGKVQKLVFDNKIDLNMQLENNVTVKDYIDGTNEQVDEVFKVTDETREEIKDPLIDVLLEQNLALTPTQRLLLAVGGHVVTMGFSAFQLAQNNKQALEAFEKFHNQLNKQKAPVYQNTQQTTKKNNSRRNKKETQEQEANYVEEVMNMMSGVDSDDIIDPQHDPSVDVVETYGEDD